MQLAAEEEVGTNAGQSVPSHLTPAKPGPAAAPAAAPAAVVAEPIPMRKRLPGHWEMAPEDRMMTDYKRRKNAANQTLVAKALLPAAAAAAAAAVAEALLCHRHCRLSPREKPCFGRQRRHRRLHPNMNRYPARSIIICPISQAAMIDPVVAADGHSYERERIERWLTIYSNKSPMTNLVLQNTVLIPNHALRQEIEDAQATLTPSE